LLSKQSKKNSELDTVTIFKMNLNYNNNTRHCRLAIKMCRKFGNNIVNSINNVPRFYPFFFNLAKEAFSAENFRTE